MPARIDAAQASPVSAWMAVSREQNDHPLVPQWGVCGPVLVFVAAACLRGPVATTFSEGRRGAVGILGGAGLQSRLGLWPGSWDGMLWCARQPEWRTDRRRA
jgi:hypothetical protein